MVKIGLLTITSERPWQVELARNLIVSSDQKAVKILEGEGVRVLHYDKIYLREKEVVEATMDFEEKGADCIVYIISSWVIAPTIITAMLKTKLPCVVWALPYPETFAITGAGAVHGALLEMGFSHKFLVGEPDDKEAVSEVVSLARAAMTVKKMREKRCGLFGGMTYGMYTATIGFSDIKAKFGVEIEHKDQLEIFLKAQQISDSEAKEFMDKVKGIYGKVDVSDEILMKSVKIYLAMKELIKEDNYDLAAVKCQPELLENFSTCCLAVDLLNNEGIATACEADINSALTMFILNVLSGQPVFTGDFVEIDVKRRVIRIVNCGGASTSLARNKKDVELCAQYEFMGRSCGVTTKFCCKPGRVTISRLGRINGQFVLLIATGEAYDVPKEEFTETTMIWPHAFVKLDGNPKVLEANMLSNHLHMTYGDLKQALLNVCELLDIKPILV